ncbi:hypothetical protein CW304_08295 [Bacillus sp. UFRGS-B20]|nr:hypothetical protein CW304_08295 [Bacillus sp. UFRGS-B20]
MPCGFLPTTHHDCPLRPSLAFHLRMVYFSLLIRMLFGQSSSSCSKSMNCNISCSTPFFQATASNAECISWLFCLRNELIVLM